KFSIYFYFSGEDKLPDIAGGELFGGEKPLVAFHATPIVTDAIIVACDVPGVNHRIIVETDVTAPHSTRCRTALAVRHIVRHVAGDRIARSEQTRRGTCWSGTCVPRRAAR